MRIALIALSLDPNSRSVNIIRAADAVDLAAESDPAPDLIVIPQGCNLPRSGGPCTPAMTETFLAVIAGKAREWGLYLAAAFFSPNGHSDPNHAALFDADGDDILTLAGQNPPLKLLDTPALIGPVGFGFTHTSPVTPPHRTGQPNIVVLFDQPLQVRPSTNRARLCNERAAEWNSPVCLVSAAMGSAMLDECTAASTGLELHAQHASAALRITTAEVTDFKTAAHAT